MTTVRKALVIGAGIAGPATALALQKAGIESTIFERRRDADDLGVMLTVASNGIDALRALDAEQVLTAGFPTPGITLRSHTGRLLGVTATGRTDEATLVSRTLRRTDLHRALHDLARSRGISVETGRRLVFAEEYDDGVRATFEDGSEARGDVLIGCDGIHSTVRRIIDPAAPTPRYAGLLTTGGYATGVEAGEEPGHYEMVFGRRAFFGHVQAPGGAQWWFVNLPQAAEPRLSHLESISTGAWRTRLQELYADDAGQALQIIEATPDFPPMTPIHTMPRLPRWCRGRMVVIGDAAHAPSPTSGQGASLSIEDGVQLARCLRDLPTVDAAFTTFEALRRPRVERIVKAAARINNSKAPGPVGRGLRDLMLPGVLRITAHSRSNAASFEHHIDWSSPIEEMTSR